MEAGTGLSVDSLPILLDTLCVCIMTVRITFGPSQEVFSGENL